MTYTYKDEKGRVWFPPTAEVYAHVCNALEKEREWRTAVTEALIVDCIYRKEHDEDPVRAVSDLCSWEVTIALDPAVSSAAQKLQDTYKADHKALQDLQQVFCLTLSLSEADFAAFKKDWEKQTVYSSLMRFPIPSTYHGGSMKKAHDYKSTTHEERYFHVHPAVTTIPEVCDGPISHFTVFARFEPEGGDEAHLPVTGQWFASIAYCSSHDQFSREKGRQVAHRKYFLGERVLITKLAEPEKGMQWKDAAILPWPKVHHPSA